jgi:23S rRNA (cytidine1920-2'-O)/16S rRNA (cytidine1409-2'-O)-methyltransferase
MTGSAGGRDGPGGNASSAHASSRKQQAKRDRLDELVTLRGLAPTRERARALILSGRVRVDGRMRDKAGTLVAADATVELVGPAEELRYVSRGGLKLEYGLDAFALDPTGCVCLDVGASTGGFTDVLLRRGAARVYAMDVGHGQLAWSLRSDPRVVVMERTNIRHVQALPQPLDCAVIDVSFISLRMVLPRVAALLAPSGWVVALVKPQFEAGKAEADRGGGVIADPVVHQRVLRELLAWLAHWDEHSSDSPALLPRGLVASPVAGREGNREYLLALVARGTAAQHEGAGDSAASPLRLLHTPTGALPIDEAITAAVEAAFDRRDDPGDDRGEHPRGRKEARDGSS